MPRTFRLFPAVALVLSLCLSPQAGAAAGPARFPASFVTAGLLLKPDETPEETLLRAHGRDTRAMTLVAVGYILGVGGFPQEYDLGSMWRRQAYTHGAPTSILSLLLLQEGMEPSDGVPSAQRLGAMAAGCEMGRSDATAELLREAGVFDLQAFCARVEVWKKDLPGWETSYRRSLEKEQLFHMEFQKLARITRELRSRPATAEESALLLGQTMSEDVRLFFAATDHDPAAQAPDPSADRLLTFMEAHLPTPKNESNFFEWALFYSAGESLVDVLAQDSGDTAEALDLIRRAHAGDPDAMRLMALRYRDGDLGFLREGSLELAWLQRAALEGGDAECMLFLAVDLLRIGNADEAWAWASLVEIARDPDERTKRLAGRLTKMIDARYGDDIVAYGRDLALFYLEERQARMERRGEAEQNRSAAPVSDKK